jgi:hypothetical protein
MAGNERRLCGSDEERLHWETGRLPRWLDRLGVIFETFDHNIKACIPIIHEVTARPREQLECCPIRILLGSRLCVFKGNQIRLKVVLHPRRDYEVTMGGKEGKSSYQDYTAGATDRHPEPKIVIGFGSSCYL